MVNVKFLAKVKPRIEERKDGEGPWAWVLQFSYVSDLGVRELQRFAEIGHRGIESAYRKSRS